MYVMHASRTPKDDPNLAAILAAISAEAFHEN
jgi:hypothetical protein